MPIDRLRGDLPDGRLLHPVRRLPARPHRPRVRPRLPHRPRHDPARGPTSSPARRCRARRPARRRRPQGRRLQQGHAAARQARPGDGPPPEVLVLDEPLNGLDPMARAEVIELLRALAGGGQASSSSRATSSTRWTSSRTASILHEPRLRRRRGRASTSVRQEVEEHPFQILVRCDQPVAGSPRACSPLDHTVEVKIHADGRGLLVRTKDAAGLLPAGQPAGRRGRARRSRRCSRPTTTSSRSTTT